MHNITELSQYYSENSDLNFELEIFNQVKNAGCVAQHGGKYIDAITEKIREFDILARIPIERFSGMGDDVFLNDIELVIECKNLSKQCPVIVGSRKFEFELVRYIQFKREGNPIPKVIIKDINIARMYNFVASFGQSFIENIGVEVFQVARNKDGSLKSSDRSSIYDKWGQAVSHTMVRYTEHKKRFDRSKEFHEINSWCIPIVVLPDESLLQAVHGKSVTLQEIIGVVVKVDASFKIEGTIGSDANISNYFLLTQSGLLKFLKMFKP